MSERKKGEKMSKIKKGLSIHCHHNRLLEYCYDYDERVEAIKTDKPKSEQKIRLRLFKLLPQEAIADLPKALVKAYAEWEKADAEWKKADAEWKKAYAEWKKAYAEEWHQKWCGCKEWNGREIVFPH